MSFNNFRIVKRHILIGILLSLGGISACDRPGLSISDTSFRFSAGISTDAQTLRTMVTLSLEKGKAAQLFSVAYSIDNNESLQITDRKGETVSNKTSISFEDFPTKTWILPILDVGEHSIAFRIKSEEYVQDILLPFSIEAAPFRPHVEISTPASSQVTTLILNLVEGVADKRYTGKVYMDGAVTDELGFVVNFSMTPTLMLELPLVRPGEHTVGVELSDGVRTQKTEARYNEPLRHSNLHVHITHDGTTGFTCMMVEKNPYGLFLSVRDSISVRGECVYNEPDMPDNYTRVTDSMEVHATASIGRFIPKDGEVFCLVNRDDAESRVTNSGHQTTLWEPVWKTDSEGYWDYIKVPGPYVPFKIISSEQYITAGFEVIDGIAVHVHCEEKGIFYNGVPLDGGEYTVPLQ